ncbi:hypothetical protein BHM03_00052121 [Ensete ventricosum]|nr:hypothetical protein BHM03_00052121 [Ensete ventricosum]
MHRVDAFGNSPGVCWKLTEDIQSLPGWRKGVRQKKIETCRKIVGGNDVVGSRRKFARIFVEGIRKLAGNTKGDRQEEDRRTCYKITGGCQSMREWFNRYFGQFTHRRSLAAARNLSYKWSNLRLGGSPADTFWPSPGFCGTGDPTVAYRRFTRQNFRKSGSLHFSNSGLTFTLTSSLVN